MDTRTENVSINNLLEQTGTLYRMILHLPFTISASSFISSAVVCSFRWNLDSFQVNSKKIGSLGATESEVWIGNFNVKVWKSTEHKLHKIWRSLKFGKISAKRAHPW